MDTKLLRSLTESYYEMYENQVEENEVIAENEIEAYDIVLAHILDEGMASSVEDAETIMGAMSAEWIQGIVEALTPLGVKTAGVVDDQRRGSTRDKDLKGTRDALDRMKAYPNGFPGVKGV